MKLPSLRHNMQTPLALLLAGGVVLALVLLAASLPTLEFSPGEHFSLPEQQELVPLRRPDMLSPDFLRALMAFLAVLLAISLYFYIRSPENRKRSLKFLGYMLLYLAVFVLILSQYGQEQAEPEVQSTQSPIALPEGPALPVTTDVPVQTVALPEPDLPGPAVYLITLAVILVFGFIGYWVWQITRPPQEQLGEIARTALSDLASGRNWDDVVIQCYADMNAAVSRGRNLKRPQAMTPREYALRLERAGLPANSVLRLTRLFEKARYGRLQSSTDEAQEAVACLSNILQAVERRA